MEQLPTESKPKRKCKKRKHIPKQPPPKSNYIGRPRKYEAWMCNKIIELGKLGKTKVQMAAAIDVSKDTIYAYCHEHKDFSDAMSLAMAYAEDFWSQLGNDGVWDIPGEKKINTGVYTFNMKNRFGWTDKAEIVQAVTSDITIRDVTKEKLKDILNDQLAAVESVPQITGPTGD